jgi:uncharacterized membrane protein YidH (DUF202 family)
VYAVGSEPDPRFTFADERTFLARIRTSWAAWSELSLSKRRIQWPFDQLRSHQP